MSGTSGTTGTGSFVRRKIDLQFHMGKGQFGEDGSDTVDLTGLRVSANIVKSGGFSMGTAQLRVYGMKLDTMNKLTTLGLLPQFVRHNFVIVKAGDDNTGMTTIFKGTINDAYIDFEAQPEVAFNVVSQAGSFEAVKPVPPQSFQGGVSAADMIKSIATQSGLDFENHGVDVKLQNQYLPGSARQQMYSAAEAANINIVIDNGTVAIWPKGKGRGSLTPIISPETGLRGYPSFTSFGLNLSVLFYPALEHGMNIKVESSLEPANKIWSIQALTYNLESERAGGPWFQQIQAGTPGYTAIV